MHGRTAIPSFTGEHWLAELFDWAERAPACARINCTTCGAAAFRNSLWASAGLASPRVPEEEIARQLAMLTAPATPEATRLVIYELYRRLGQDGLDRLALSFSGTTAAAEYARMHVHSRALAEQRRAAAYRNSPAYGEDRRAERAARHSERLAAKVVRDAARRGQGEGEA